MKKKIILVLSLALFLAGCQKKVDLKSTWEGVYERAELAFDATNTPDEQDAVLTHMADTAVILLKENIDSPYADTLFMGVYYMLTPEQKQELFAVMPESMLADETIKELQHTFLKEIATSTGNPYTDITGVQPNGEELSLSALVGKTDFVLVDFWASWCGPCRRLIPVLKEIYAGQPAGKFQILSCSVDQEDEAWRAALEEEQMPWPQIHEVQGRYEGSDLYGVRAIPTTILIDKEGMIIARNPDEAELEQILWGEE